MKHQEYQQIVQEQIARQIEVAESGIEQAAAWCAESVKANRIIHVFGTGHSQMFAMEVFYRAGGLVPVNALLEPHYALFPKAILSTAQERIEGFSDQYLQTQNTAAEDTMIIVSIAGRNPSAVDMALEAKRIGMKVIALSSLDFAGGVSSRHSSGKLLKDVADSVIDIQAIKGDAVLEIEGMRNRFCGTSTILGMLVMQSIMARTVELLVEAGITPPLYVSANLDEGDQNNAALIEKYSPLVDCL